MASAARPKRSAAAIYWSALAGLNAVFAQDEAHELAVRMVAGELGLTEAGARALLFARVG